MNVRTSFIVLALLAGMATAAFADAQLSVKPQGEDEAGQRIQRGGGNSGPDSWQFWGPQRQLLNNKGEDEAGQKIQRGGGNSGPDSWQFWGPQRQLLNKEAAPVQKPQATPQAPKQAAPVKETAPKAAAPQQLAKKPESAPKPAATTPKQTAMKPAAKPEAAQKQQDQQTQPQQAAPQGMQAPKSQNERGSNRGWAWAGNSDFANIPGGGQAYPLMYVRNIYSGAGWGGAPTTCAQGEFAHACSTRRRLMKWLGF